MTLFEIIITCVVAALVVATIFMFYIGLSYIRQLNITNKRVVTLTNAVFECRSFLEKLSKHDVIVKINKISDIEKKVGELTGICKNQTNNVTQIGDTLNKTLEDIKLRNTLIRDNHKLLDSINAKTIKIQDDINKIGEIVVDINMSNNSTNINKNISTSYEDLKEKILRIDRQHTMIIKNVDSLTKCNNNNINATGKAFLAINDTLNIINDNINTIIETNKISDVDIAKISSVLNSYKEKINSITTYIEIATKLKTASKTKSTQTKTIKRPIIKK